MKIEIDNWFAKKLETASIKAEQLQNNYPASIPFFGVYLKEWRATAKLAKKSGMRLVSIWASEVDGDDCSISLYAVFASKERQVIIKTTAGFDAPIPSISCYYISVVRMERTMQDMFGLIFDGLYDSRQWIKHESWDEKSHPLRLSFKADTLMAKGEGEYRFIKAEGDGVLEIPVGPVHAGIIEPGHFRFLAVGEEILNLEERLGYTHKGIEKRLEGMTASDAIKIASRVSGDTTVGHGWAFARACENAASMKLTERADSLRGILCERERMANHIGDIGAICNDAAFAFMHIQMQRLREDMAVKHKEIFGHRFMMDSIIIGGVSFDLDDKSIDELKLNTRLIAKEVEQLREIYNNNDSIQERVVGSGIIKKDIAKSIGLLGYAGRASGLSNDVRADVPYPPYDKIDVDVFHKAHGDVATRITVRFEEIKESARIINHLLDNLPEGKIASAWQPPKDGISGFATIEGWRGEIAHWVLFNSNGTISRCMIEDPSAVNWLGVEIAVRGLPVPDFPLNNKSFNCSYSGNDL